MFLEFSEDLQENTCPRVSFLIKLQAKTCNFIKKETLAHIFSCEFWEISRNSSFKEHLRATASGSKEKDLMNFGDVRDSYFTAISQFTMDLATFTEGILNEKLHFFVQCFCVKYNLTKLAFICSKSSMETPEQCVKFVQSQWRRSSVFIANFEHISHTVLVFHWWLWTSKYRLDRYF